MRVVVDDPAAVEQKDKADKPGVMSRQKALLEERYDLRNDASPVRSFAESGSAPRSR